MTRDPKGSRDFYRSAAAIVLSRDYEEKRPRLTTPLLSGEEGGEGREQGNAQLPQSDPESGSALFFALAGPFLPLVLPFGLPRPLLGPSAAGLAGLAGPLGRPRPFLGESAFAAFGASTFAGAAAVAFGLPRPFDDSTLGADAFLPEPFGRPLPRFTSGSSEVFCFFVSVSDEDKSLASE